MKNYNNKLIFCMIQIFKFTFEYIILNFLKYNKFIALTRHYQQIRDLKINANLKFFTATTLLITIIIKAANGLY